MEGESGGVTDQLIDMELEDPAQAEVLDKTGKLNSMISTLQQSMYLQQDQQRMDKDVKLLQQVPIFPNTRAIEGETRSPDLRQRPSLPQEIWKKNHGDSPGEKPDQAWKLYLTYAMADDDADVWFTEVMKPLEISWLTAQRHLMEKFSNKDRKIDAAMELFDLAMWKPSGVWTPTPTPLFDQNKVTVDMYKSTRLHLVGKSNTIQSYGLFKAILVSFYIVTLEHQFEVIDLQRDTDCFISLPFP